MKFVHE